MLLVARGLLVMFRLATDMYTSARLATLDPKLQANSIPRRGNPRSSKDPLDPAPTSDSVKNQVHRHGWDIPHQCLIGTEVICCGMHMQKQDRVTGRRGVERIFATAWVAPQ
jgi:hypothetical protein